MAQSLQKIFTFDEFIEFLSTQPEIIRYELYDGEIIQMPQPKGKHEEIIAFLAAILGYEFVRLKLKYGISNQGLVQSKNKQSGYFPDILVLNLSNLVNEPYWQEESILIQPESIPLVIEVVSQCVARVPRVEATDVGVASPEEIPVRVSTNWRDDYHKKFADYEEMGIQEYWIVDYAALGSKALIGDPKQPTITIYSLSDEGEYSGKQFRRDDCIESPTFPDLNLTAQQILEASY
ncbi:MAG: Uma2 family endonuclease [Calothrix sp. MO_167.B42]|nr:Uma2 family endonuclease [Calothrix sp. MO_167.B42]